jgi:FKBP-type peptidyl-prolyl cis-trans isomerase FkpA
VRLRVRDLHAAADWLEKTLGWKPVYRDGARARYARLQLDAADADGGGALVLASEDVDADDARLRQNGAVPIEPPSDRPSGYRESRLRAPGGLSVELEGPLAAPPEFSFTELSAGTGAAPGPNDTVRVRYVGTLKDGTVFDDAHRKGRAALVPVGSAIRCWRQALGRMKAGGKARFTCPSDMAYGKQGRAPLIPPSATLLFEVELIDVLR